MGPGAVFDLRGERRPGHHHLLAWRAHRRNICLELVELLLQPPRLVMLEAGADAADILPAVAVPCSEEKAERTAGV
jgi:hypothetical protein